MLDPLKHMNVLRLEYYDVIFSIQTLYKAWIFFKLLCVGERFNPVQSVVPILR